MTTDQKDKPKSKVRDASQIAQFVFDDVLVAVPAPPTTIRSYLRHAVQMRSESGDRPGVRGRNALFTLNRIMQIAITHELASMGVSPKVAAEAALDFTDLPREALDGSIFGGDPCEKPRRKPGHLFPGDRVSTILWIERFEDGGPTTRVMPLPFGQPVGDGHIYAGLNSAGIFVDVTKIAAEVEQRLGVIVPGREV